MEKKKYEKAEMDIIVFDCEDIITDSSSTPDDEVVHTEAEI